MEQLKKEVGQMIQEARKAKGLTQAELAEKLGVTQSAIRNYESGKQNLTLETMHKLSNVLGVRFVVEPR